MELLLGLKGFRIQQIDNIRAKMPVGIGYTLIIDVTEKPAAWEIKSRAPGDQEEYISTLYCEFKEPEKEHKNATELVTAYQMALVDRVMGIEGMPVIKPPKSRARSQQAQAQAVEDPLPEEPVLEEMAVAMDEEPEVKAEEEKVQPEEPKVKEEILPGPKISPSAAEKFYSNALKIPDNPAALAILAAGEALEKSSPADPGEAKKKQEPDSHSQWISGKVCPKCGGSVYLQYTIEPDPFIFCEKCGATYPYTEIDKLEPAKEPINIPDFELEKVKESIQVQKPEPFPEQIIRNLSQDGIIITKNAKGMYQWEITARSDSLNTAIEKALLADKKLREELRGGA